jgi:hypothetical protein
MEAIAHVYTTFAPVAVGLLAACALLATSGGNPVLRRRIPAVAALWFVSSITVLVLVLAASSTESHFRFAAQRDVGYWVGAVVGLAVPFIVCAALAYASPLLHAKPQVRFLVLMFASAGPFLAAPQIFAVGWVAGCTFVLYPSCM